MRKDFRATHCKRGHEFTPENTRISGRGTRCCKICQELSKRQWQKQNPKAVAKHRRRTLLHCKFGLTEQQYAGRLQEQDQKCAICRKPQSQLAKRLAVDHDHLTGSIRGLLCDNCNPGLGKFQDSPELLRAAADYLESYANVPNTHKKGEGNLGSYRIEMPSPAA